MSFPTVLLAKTPKQKDRPAARETFIGHMQDVSKVAGLLVENIGDYALGAMGLVAFQDELRRSVLGSAVLHDLGKANSQFQRSVRAGGQITQAFRHECLGVWLVIRFPEFKKWLFSGLSETSQWAVMFAVLGHHLKVKDGTAIIAREGSGEAGVDLYTDHPDFISGLKFVRDSLELPMDAPRLPRVKVDLLSPRPLGDLLDWLVDAVQWFESSPVETRRFVALIKALLVAADVAGSALPRVGIDPGVWTDAVLKRVCLPEDLDDIALKRLDGQPPRSFQKHVADSASRVTFVKAGCGSGKTVAAYLWAARNASGRKLFICYPTTGTATEGFRDYILPADMSADSMLLHSRSEFDLEGMLPAEEEAIECATRVESLVAWDVPLIVCTADQVLGIIQNGRRALFSFPSIGNGAFVFDEIHQYDERLFGALLRFLEAFPEAPILLMTASLPVPRLEAVRGLLARRGTRIEVIEGPADFQDIERYQVLGIQKSPPWERIENTLRDGGKVLWVSNTVGRCVQSAQEAQRRRLAPLPYHSRYRYCDRIKKHEAVIEAFKTRNPALAITTQVCEVSLDISADLLITDLAPVPALIQRLGRLNRRATPDTKGNAKPALVLAAESPLPYESADLDVAVAWLKCLGTQPLSQNALASAFEDMTQNNAAGPVSSAWLDGGPFAGQAPLRETVATIPVVRSEDEPLCLDQKGRPIAKETTRFSIPMTLGPVSGEVGGWKQMGFVFVAPEARISYSEEWGATWAKR